MATLKGSQDKVTGGGRLQLRMRKDGECSSSPGCLKNKTEVDLSVCPINYQHKSRVSEAAAVKVPVVSMNRNLIITTQA